MLFDCYKKKVTFDNINNIYLIPANKDIKSMRNDIWWSEYELLNIRKKLELELHIIYKLHNIKNRREAFNFLNK